MLRIFISAIICQLASIHFSYAQFKYPAARKEAFDIVIYGKSVTDEYFWMSRKENAEEVKEFRREQGKLAQTILDSIPGTQMITKERNEAMDAIKDEIWNGKAV